MKHTPSTEGFEIYCQEHRPFQLDIDENRSLWDRIDSIGQTVEQYHDFYRKNCELVKSSLKLTSDEAYAVEASWSDTHRRQLFEFVA